MSTSLTDGKRGNCMKWLRHEGGAALSMRALNPFPGEESGAKETAVLGSPASVLASTRNLRDVT